MIKKLTIFAAIILTVALSGEAGANAQGAEQAKDTAPEQVAGIPFGKYVQSAGYLDSLKRTVKDFEAKFGDCDSAAYDARMQIGQPQVPVSFPNISGVAPQWIEVVRVEGCEAPYVRGVLVALHDNQVNFYPLLKGNGVSGVLLQQMVAGKLLLREKDEASNAGCKTADPVRITKHDMVDKTKKSATGDWDEVWHVTNCKGQKYVQVTFKNGADGDAEFSFQEIKEGK